MKLRWKILIAFGIVLVLVAASLTVTMHVQPANEVDAYKKFLRDHGEKLEINEVLPPPVAEASNGATLARSAFSLLPPDNNDYTNLPAAMQMIAPGKALVDSAQPQVQWVGEWVRTDSWDNAQAAIEAEQPAINLLKQAAAFPALDFHPRYQDCWKVEVPYLAAMRHSAVVLAAAAVCDLHNGDIASAATNLCMALALEQADHDERVAFSQEVRFARAAITLGATWEWLQSTNITDTQLARVQDAWQQQEYFSGVEGAELMQRACQDHMLQIARASYSDFVNLASDGPTASFPTFSSSDDWKEDIRELASDGSDYAVLTLWQNSWSFPDEERMLKKYQITLDAFRSAPTNNALKPLFDSMESQLAAVPITNAPSTLLHALHAEDAIWVFSRSFFSTFPWLKLIQAEASRRIVITAIALKRYQLKHGTFPENLSELTPGFLSSTPLDPVDGKPLRYRRNADGTYVLYSVGEDGVDDGGDTTPVRSTAFPTPSSWGWLHARDWVWPQPATPAEIKTRYDQIAARAAAINAAGNGPLDPVTGLPVLPAKK